LDPRFEAPARDVDRAGDVPLVPLVVAADVDPRRAVELLRLAGVDLLDLCLRLLEKFPVGRHCFKKNSSAAGVRATVSNGLSQRLQLVVTVAAVAVAAAGAVIGVTLETRDNPPKLHPQPGKPPVPAKLPGPVGAEIMKALADWPHGSVAALERLGQQHPKSPLVQLYRGIGLLWAGYTSESETA